MYFRKKQQYKFPFEDHETFQVKLLRVTREMIGDSLRLF